MAIDLISNDERIAIDLHGVRFWARRILSSEQKRAEAQCTKKGQTDYIAVMDLLLSDHIVGWEPHPDAVRENGREVAFSVQALARLPIGVKNDLIARLYDESPDYLGNSNAGSAALTPREA